MMEPRQGKDYPAWEDEYIKDAARRGVSLEMIALPLGRTPNAIRKRISHLRAQGDGVKPVMSESLPGERAPANAGAKWDEREYARLYELHGLTAAEAGKIMGRPTRGIIRSRQHMKHLADCDNSATVPRVEELDNAEPSWEDTESSASYTTDRKPFSTRLLRFLIGER